MLVAYQLVCTSVTDPAFKLLILTPSEKIQRASLLWPTTHLIRRVCIKMPIKQTCGRPSISLVAGWNSDGLGWDILRWKQSGGRKHTQNRISKISTLNLVFYCMTLPFKPMCLRLLIDMGDDLHIAFSPIAVPKQCKTLDLVELPRGISEVIVKSLYCFTQIRWLTWLIRVCFTYIANYIVTVNAGG